MDWIKTFIFKKILSRWIPFKWIDGRKREISRWVTFVFGILAVVQEFFPTASPFIKETTAVALTILGLLGIQIGEMHAEAKEEGNFGVRYGDNHTKISSRTHG